MSKDQQPPGEEMTHSDLEEMFRQRAKALYLRPEDIDYLTRSVGLTHIDILVELDELYEDLIPEACKAIAEGSPDAYYYADAVHYAAESLGCEGTDDLLEFITRLRSEGVW